MCGTPEVGVKHGDHCVKQELTPTATRQAAIIRAFPALTRAEAAAAHGGVQVALQVLAQAEQGAEQASRSLPALLPV